jgi:DNA-binding MarR family transcriptional regulator
MNLTSHSIKTVHQWATALVDGALKEHGLTVSAPQAYILVALLDMKAKAAPSQKLLAEHAGIDKMTTHEIIKRLEGRGYLTRGKARKIPNSFGRETPIELTKEGLTAAQIAKTALVAVDCVIFEAAGCFAVGFEDGLGELVDMIRKRPQVE